MTKYIISGTTSIELNDKGEISPADLEKALVASLGFQPRQVEDVTVWINENESYWLAHEQPLPADGEEREEAVKAISEKTGARLLMPSMDHAFAQHLMRQLPMNITGEAFVAGSLAGQWRVESVSRYNPYNMGAHGLLANKEQPISYTAQSLPLAVSMLFLSVLGVGQRAYVFIPDSAQAEGHLIYLTAENEKGMLELLPETSLFRMEGLDKYAVVGMEQDLIKEAIEKAQLLRTIALAKVKTDAPQPEPELVAAAAEAAPAKAE